MQKSEIMALMRSMDIPETELIETHISWVILTEEYAYKIKRPVRFSFLNFDTLAQRHHFCLREAELNRRLTHDMYLGVVAVRQTGNSITIDNGTGKVIEYAVKMRRIPGDRQMDILLLKGLVTTHHVEQIAGQLAAFHSSARVTAGPPDVEVMRADFADLSNCAEFISSRFGATGSKSLDDGITFAARFLQKHAARIRERHALGFVVDGHGDLHSKNIFLLEAPVIFDCIEFSDHLRQVDVLDELAFFCLDLELFGYQDLASHFMEHYLTLFRCMITDEDMRLFKYYQLYRAGVKLKINCIKAMETSESSDKQHRLSKVDGYFGLFREYLEELTQQNDTT